MYMVGSANKDVHFNYMADFDGQGFLNKDPTVVLDGASPANTCIPGFLPRNEPMQPYGITAPKSALTSI
jgi:hypothetical protein